MKKYLLGFIVGIMLFSFIGVYASSQFIAEKANFPVIINSEEFVPTTGDILLVNGRTYLPLRDIGVALGVDVRWNDDLMCVEVVTPTPILTNTPTPPPAPQRTPVVSNETTYELNNEVIVETNIGDYSIKITDVKEISLDELMNVKSNAKQGVMIDYIYSNISYERDLFLSNMDFIIIDENNFTGNSTDVKLQTIDPKYPKYTAKGISCKARMFFTVDDKSDIIELVLKNNSSIKWKIEISD